MNAARTAGIAAVTANTPEQWAKAFDREVKRLARQSKPFDVYRVLARVGRPPEGTHPSAIGARMRSAAQRGVVVKAGYAERPSHGDVVTLWMAA